MSILVQFEVILASFFFGMIFMILFDLFNRLFYRKKGKLVRLVAEVLFFCIMALLFFYIMLKIANARLNIFIPLFIIIGALIYIFYLQNYFLTAYQFVFNKIHNKIKQKKLYWSARIDAMKMKKRKAKYQKQEKRKKLKIKKNKKEKMA